MSSRALWLLLPLFGLSSCVVPGLELGPGQSGAGGAGGAGGSSASGAGGDAGTSPMGGAAVVAGGGSGGAAEPRCEDFPIPPKSIWRVAASSSSLGTLSETDPLYNPPSNAIDDSLTDRWASGQAQETEGQWFHVDFGTTVAISEVTLEQGTNLDDYPRGYEISLSYRHTDFDAAASATGQGASVSETVIPLDKRAVGRYMLVRQTGTATRWWSIAEINVACH